MWMAQINVVEAAVTLFKVEKRDKLNKSLFYENDIHNLSWREGIKFPKTNHNNIN